MTEEEKLTLAVYKQKRQPRSTIGLDFTKAKGIPLDIKIFGFSDWHFKFKIVPDSKRIFFYVYSRAFALHAIREELIGYPKTFESEPTEAEADAFFHLNLEFSYPDFQLKRNTHSYTDMSGVKKHQILLDGAPENELYAILKVKHAVVLLLPELQYIVPQEEIQKKSGKF
jgi:hypothetical protein